MSIEVKFAGIICCSMNLPAEGDVERRVAFCVSDVDVDTFRGGVVVEQQLEHLKSRSI